MTYYTVRHKMKPTLVPLAILILCLSGCKDSGDASRVSPAVAAEINRIQSENALSDEEISQSLERWVEMYAGTRDLLESEDLFGGGAWSPERLSELMAESEKALKAVRHEDQMFAIYSLGHLSALNDKRYEEAAQSLRRIVARHYAAIKENPNKAGESFVKRVHDFSATDPKLKSLIQQNELGEQDAGGKGG